MPKNLKETSTDLEVQYQLYLKRMGMREENMPEMQKTQLKEAFYGASGQLLVLFRDVISEMPEDKAIDCMEDLVKQTVDFWRSALDNYSKKKG